MGVQRLVENYNIFLTLPLVANQYGFVRFLARLRIQDGAKCGKSNSVWAQKMQMSSEIIYPILSPVQQLQLVETQNNLPCTPTSQAEAADDEILSAHFRYSYEFLFLFISTLEIYSPFLYLLIIWYGGPWPQQIELSFDMFVKITALVQLLTTAYSRGHVIQLDR